MVIIGNWSSISLKKDYDKNIKTFALLDVSHAKIPDKEPELKVKLYAKHPPSVFFHLHLLKYFIIAEIDLPSLKLALHKLKESIWWNVYGFFTIQKIQLNSCNEAYDYLKVIWSFKILSTIFVCKGLDSRIELHTFNPYSDYAPVVWKKYDASKQVNGHPFYLFKYDHTDFDGRFSFEYIFALLFHKLSTPFCRKLSNHIIDIDPSSFFFNFDYI